MPSQRVLYFLVSGLAIISNLIDQYPDNASNSSKVCKNDMRGSPATFKKDQGLRIWRSNSISCAIAAPLNAICKTYSPSRIAGLNFSAGIGSIAKFCVGWDEHGSQ